MRFFCPLLYHRNLVVNGHTDDGQQQYNIHKASCNVILAETRSLTGGMHNLIVWQQCSVVYYWTIFVQYASTVNSERDRVNCSVDWHKKGKPF